MAKLFTVVLSFYRLWFDFQSNWFKGRKRCQWTQLTRIILHQHEPFYGASKMVWCHLKKKKDFYIIDGLSSLLKIDDQHNVVFALMTNTLRGCIMLSSPAYSVFLLIWTQTPPTTLLPHPHMTFNPPTKHAEIEWVAYISHGSLLCILSLYALSIPLSLPLCCFRGGSVFFLKRVKCLQS